MKLYLVVFIALLFLVSCSQKATPPGSVKNDFSGTWQVISVNGIAVVKKDAGKEMPYLDFNTANNTLTGTTGCNRINGKVTISQTSIIFGPIATTMMLCPNAQYESTILQTLKGNLSYTYEKGVITLSKEGRNRMTLAK